MNEIQNIRNADRLGSRHKKEVAMSEKPTKICGNVLCNMPIGLLGSKTAGQRLEDTTNRWIGRDWSSYHSTYDTKPTLLGYAQ